jgi:hypothetical protein
MMPVFHQMGHQSDNLLADDRLSQYAGAILSPVNYDQSAVDAQIRAARAKPQFETIFDPQLYLPNTERECLRKWSYFPADVDTADLSSEAWWQALVNAIAGVARALAPAAVCSPVVVPKVFDDDYFSRLVDIAGCLRRSLNGSNIRMAHSALVSLADLSSVGRALTVASILSRTSADFVYLVVLSAIEPRRELADTEELKGAMRLIAELEKCGLRVLVGYCSSDILLWKAAGATSCATGKFFNLRRFTPSRFEEPATQGGGQLSYWLEESLVAFLRESDLLRVQPRALLDATLARNPFSAQIMEQLKESPGTPWVGLGWRQFMYWFADVERRIGTGEIQVGRLLQEAEGYWETLEDAGVLMEERRNDGRWLRPWRRAVAEYSA